MESDLFYINATGFVFANMTLFGCVDCIDTTSSSNIVISNVSFYNSGESILPGNHSIIQNCEFRLLGLEKFRDEYLTLNNDTIIFNDLFDVPFSQPMSAIVVSIEDTGVIGTNITIKSNVFYNSQGIYLLGCNSIFLYENTMYEVVRPPIICTNNKYVDFHHNFIGRADNLLYSGSGNLNLNVHHNILYTNATWRPNLYYYIFLDNYSGDNEKYDANINVTNNILWACGDSGCELISSVPSNNNSSFIFANNIAQLAPSHFLGLDYIQYTIKKNIFVSSDLTSNTFYDDTFCVVNDELMCVYKSVDQIFRDVSTRNFGINQCFIQELEESTDQGPYTSILPWFGTGLGSSNGFFGEGEGNYVGPYPGNYFYDEGWPAVAPRKYYDTTFNHFCDSCIQITRLFFFPDNQTCDVSNSTPPCGICTSGSLDGSVFVVNQSLSVISNLVVSNSNLTYQGDVLLDRSYTLTLQNTNLVIIGALALSYNSSIVVTYTTNVTIEGSASFNGTLVVDFSNLTYNEFDTISKKPRELFTYNSLNSQFKSFQVTQPPMSTTGGVIGDNPITFDIQYTNTSLILVRTSLSPTLMPSLSPTSPSQSQSPTLSPSQSPTLSPPSQSPSSLSSTSVILPTIAIIMYCILLSIM
eukprot:TRINITY_DN1560_c0_g1_i10.p1 TRINITY_DN1560_c0_g1~~TRINITY_DN1560_c0_g1_i10.p1  ORF type:complete len:639 (+),score=67.07 TRINITY_DN1560_c0_g1_i10:678-2594(+)